ncbi:unnamed protein product, partial [Mesorhabditis belari]|uniref:Sulfotransferase family protein n=1 Tax=Mesorhabditis belari TaxID=2138241 RepID=A0AAF3F730_9BILA
MIQSNQQIHQQSRKSRSDQLKISQNFHEAGIFFCQIPKNGATIMQIILCDLFRYYKGIPFKVEYGQGKQSSNCQAEGWYKKLSGIRSQNNTWEPNQEDTLIAVIRHPLKRFLSLYRYLCEQLQMCGSANIHEFTKDVYTLLTTRSIHGTHFKDSDQKIVEYHAQPQTWFCILSHNSQKFHLIRNEGDRLAMHSELKTAFEEAKVPKFYSDQVLFHVVYSDTAHANKDKDRTKQLETSFTQNPLSMTYFNAIYYKDFELFGYQK